MFESSIQSMVKTKTAESAGIQCVIRNIEGIVKLAAILRSSYGPSGTYKLIVSGNGKVTISRSTSSILSGCDIEHPAVKMLVEPISHLAQLGDCTGFMMGMMGEILQRSAELIEQGVLPTEISSGLRECLKLVPQSVEDALSERVVFSLTDTASLKKVLGGIIKERKLVELLAESIATISKSGPSPADSVRVTKVNTGSLGDSERFQGMLLECSPVGTVKEGKNLKTAIYSCPLATSTLETKGTVLFKTADDLLAFSSEDEKAVEKFVDALIGNGVGLIICTGSVDSLMLDYLSARGVAVLKIQSKLDIRRLLVLFGGRVFNSMQPLDSQSLGHCDELRVCVYGERNYTKVSGKGSIDTILVRGSLPSQLEEHERMLGKATCALQACVREAYRLWDGTDKEKETSKTVALLPGAGAAEKRIADALRRAAESYTDIRQVCIKLVSASLESIARSLDGVSPEEAAAVYDIAQIKERALWYALTLSADILAISQMFVTKNEDQLKAPKRPGHWDDED